MEWGKTLALRAFGLTKIPLLFFVGPSIEKMTASTCVVKIPLNYRTKNHLGSMYFGVLAAGADCAGALFAVDAIQKSKSAVDFIFKDFSVDFHRRAEADVHFTSKDGAAVRKQVAAAIKTGKRVNKTVTIVATTPSLSGTTPVATFKLTLSLKAQTAKNKKRTRTRPAKRLVRNKTARKKPTRRQTTRRKAARKKPKRAVRLRTRRSRKS